MRIAMIGQKGIPAYYGGVERHVHDISVALVRHGQDVTVYGRTWYTKKTPRYVDGVRVIYTPSIVTKHLDAASHTFFSTLHALFQPYDIIHYHGVGPALFSWIPRLFSPGKTVITTFHTIDRKNEKWGPIARLCLKLGEWAACRFAHRTIAVSESLEQYIRDVYDTAAAYIPNSVPLYQKTTDTAPLKRWDIVPGKYILMVARLIPLKGAHYLLRAYIDLVKNNPDALKGHQLVIVGDSSHTNTYVRHLKALAKDTPGIIFTGVQSGKALASLMSHTSLMVHPSAYEGLPLSVLEGMSYGVPLIVSDILEHRTLISNPDFRFTPKDSTALAHCIERALARPEKEQCEAIQKNRALIEQQFTTEKTVLDIIHLYHEERRKQQTARLSSSAQQEKTLAAS